MQDDGNLVLYDAHQSPIWASNTWNKGSKPHHLVQQDDGNLVLYDAHRTATWSSNTYGKTAPPSYNAPSYVPPPPVRNSLHANQALNQNDFIKAPGFEFYARVQSDGNFVLYTSNSFES